MESPLPYQGGFSALYLPTYLVQMSLVHFDHALQLPITYYIYPCL